MHEVTAVPARALLSRPQFYYQRLPVPLLNRRNPAYTCNRERERERGREGGRERERQTDRKREREREKHMDECMHACIIA